MPNSAPTINGRRKNIVSNEQLSLSQIVTASDADGDDITRYEVQVFGNGRGGYLYLGTRRLAPNTVYQLTASEWAQLSFQARLRGRRAYQTRFEVRAHDGTDWSSWGEARLNTLQNANRPVIRAPARIQVDAGTVTPITELFEFFDEDRSTAKVYRFEDVTDGQSYLALRGRKFDGRLQIKADRLDEVSYVTSDEKALDRIQIRGFDGRFWSRIKNIRIEAITRPELVKSHNIVLNEQQQISPYRLVRKGDSGPGYRLYEFIDGTSGFRSGGFYDGIDALATGVKHTVTPGELSRLKFEGGKFEQRSHDEIYFRAYNGKRWSKWENINVNTEPRMTDALASSSWTEFEPTREPTILTYSFLNLVPSYYATGAPERRQFTGLTNELRQTARHALNAVEDFANVRFVEVPDNGLSQGTITFGMADLDDTALAWAYLPNLPETRFRSLPGDIWYNWWDFPLFWVGPGDKGPGSAPYETTIHELGHAMGLKHPFDGFPILSTETNHSGMTVLSYSPHPDNVNPLFPNVTLLNARTFQLYDIASFHEMYGANMNYSTGDDVYTYERDEQILDAIWDAGGNDTIDASNQVVSANIDLRQGQYSSISRHFDQFIRARVASVRNLGIAYGAEIENAIGTNFNDNLTGNELDNRLEGGAGRDVLRGRQGNDRLIGGSHSDTYFYHIGDGDDTIADGGGGVDELQIHWLEQIAFSSLAFRRNGNDLFVDLTIEGPGSNSEGTIKIERAVGSNRIESLQIYHDGRAFGKKVDLTSVYTNAKSNAQNFEVTDVLGSYGYLASPV